jgi:hypothetical protein
MIVWAAGEAWMRDGKSISRIADWGLRRGSMAPRVSAVATKGVWRWAGVNGRFVVDIVGDCRWK